MSFPIQIKKNISQYEILKDSRLHTCMNCEYRTFKNYKQNCDIKNDCEEIMKLKKCSEFYKTKDYKLEQAKYIINKLWRKKQDLINFNNIVKKNENKKYKCRLCDKEISFSAYCINGVCDEHLNTINDVKSYEQLEEEIIELRSENDSMSEIIGNKIEENLDLHIKYNSIKEVLEKIILQLNDKIEDKTLDKIKKIFNI